MGCFSAAFQKQSIRLILLFSIIIGSQNTFSCVQEGFQHNLSEREVDELARGFLSLQGDDASNFRKEIKSNCVSSRHLVMLIGMFFEKSGQLERARKAFQFSAQLGYGPALFKLGEYQVLGKGGKQNIKKGLLAARVVAEGFYGQGSVSYLLNDFSNLTGYSTQAAEFQWNKWYMDKNVGEIPDSYVAFKVNDLVRSAEIWLKYVKFDDREEEVTFFKSLQRYLLLAGNTFEARRMEQRLNNGGRKGAQAILADENFVRYCKKYFVPSENYFENFEKVQSEIYRSPESAQKLISEYHLGLAKKQYPEDYVTSMKDKISVRFISLSAASLIRLITDHDRFLKEFGQGFIKIDSELLDLKIGTDAISVNGRELLSSLVSKLDLDVVCDEQGLTYRTNQRIPKYFYFNPHFVQEWSGDLKLKEQGLKGQGVVKVGPEVKFIGKIKNSRLNGKGKLVIHDDLKVKSDSFRNGMIFGNSEIWSDGKLLMKGDFRGGELNGEGELAAFNWEYQGEFEKGLKHGRGKIKFVGRNLPASSIPSDPYPLYENHIVKAWYEGRFEYGRPQGAGRCGLGHKKGQEDVYKCQFLDGQLVSFAGVSLLPPEMKPSDIYKLF